MESLFRPPYGSQSSSGKLSNANGFSAGNAYDDLFAGPRRFGAPALSPSVEDYADIFGGSQASRASSIPTIDLSALEETGTLTDARSSKPDYLDIFGGFGDEETALSFEELCKDPKGGDDFSFSGKAWTKAKTMPHYEGSDGFYYSKGSQMFSNESDGVKRFNMSFHKTSPRRNSGTNGTTHVAQFHAIPGFTYFSDENTMQKKDCDKSVPLVKNTVNHNIDFGGKERKRQTMSNLTKQQTSDSRVKFENVSGWDGFHSNDKSFHVYDISPKASEISPPSRLPAKLGSNKGDSKASVANNFKVFKNDPSKGGAGDCSPPFSDEEMDVNSAAAASVAALRKAIEKAQASIRIAKESMERKDGLQRFSKLSSKSDLDTKDRKVNKISSEANKKEKKNAKGLCERVDTGSQVFAGIGRHNVTRSNKMPTGFKDSEECLVAGKLVEEANGIRSELAEECETAKQFCEVVNTSKCGTKSLISEQTDSNSNTMQSVDAYDCAAKDMKPSKEVLEQQEGNGNKALEEVLEQDNMEAKPNASRMVEEWEEHVTKLVSAQEVHRPEENEYKGVVQDSEESEEKQKIFNELEKCEKGLKESQEPIQNERFECQESKEYDNEQRQDEILEWMENEKKQEEVLGQKQNENILNDAHEKEENETRLQKIREQVEKRLKEACEWIRYGNKSKVSLDGERNEKIQNDARKEDNEMSLDKAHELEIIKKRLSNGHDSEEIENRLKEDCEREGSEKKLMESHEFEETETIWRGVERHKENEEIGRNDEAFEEEKSLDAASVACETNAGESTSLNQEAYIHEEKSSGLDISQQVTAHEDNERELYTNEVFCDFEEDGKEPETFEVQFELEEKDVCKTDGSVKGFSQYIEIENKNKTAHEDNERELYPNEVFCDFEEDGKEPETFEVQFELEEKNMCKTDGSLKGVSQHIEIENKNITASETFPFHENPASTCVITANFGHERIDQNEKESEFGSNLGYDTEMLEHELGESEEKVVEAEIAFDQELEKERLEVEMEASQPQLGEIKDRVKKAEMAVDQEQDENNFETAAKDKEEVELENKMEESQPYNLFYLNGEGKVMEIEEEIASNQSKGESANYLKGASAVEEKEGVEAVQKEVLLDKEHLKTDGATKGEREREKDRIAVERAIREARERAFVEARERAFVEARERAERAAVERVTAEARQRVMAGTREKFEKTSGGSKSSSEKTSIEAKLRAERAAVERATAEARERALEKALSQKATSGVSRDIGVMRSFSSSDLHRSDESNGESAQRRKASLERHQRTMERAAKALEEKNMRDLLAQKEQAERNRLAEVLDADVKRWSSGKEGNLRALLSTLQYILGPNSGWQPVSLTDIITINAVKKAYRKATLCVHPDKLQQRGASIQQKYICEKVFDLLKAAWNKFNSEER